MKTRRIKVKVTKKDIEAGGAYSSDCPVALAVQRTTGNQDLRVGHYSLGIDFTTTVSLHSKTLTKWILDYDMGEKVKPTTFAIYVPCNCIECSR